MSWHIFVSFAHKETPYITLIDGGRPADMETNEIVEKHPVTGRVS